MEITGFNELVNGGYKPANIPGGQHPVGLKRESPCKSEKCRILGGRLDDFDLFRSLELQKVEQGIDILGEMRQ